MLNLHARLPLRRDAEPLVARISTDASRAEEERGQEALLLQTTHRAPAGFAAYLQTATCVGTCADEIWPLPDSLNHLADGDIVRLSPRAGEIWVMYRRSSPFNSMLLTEQCNSDCVMCSQPPKRRDDRYLVQAWLDAIRLMSSETVALGITGGEPTLLGKDLHRIIVECRDRLPNTALHMLSNGRLFNYLSLCRNLAAIGHPDLMVGIPLYSDLASHHDFVVQARGAFDQTLRGFMNLQRCGVRTELRVVLHRLTIDRLPQLARFIARNLPYVEHVALMGLEMMGYVRMNLDALWIDPADYRAQLHDAVVILDRHGMNVSIYNHQLCVLNEDLWPFARKSISDWKNEYLRECAECAVRDQCGGFFASASLRRSRDIAPIQSSDTDCPLTSSTST